jgi:hypothetical protein
MPFTSDRSGWEASLNPTYSSARDWQVEMARSNDISVSSDLDGKENKAFVSGKVREVKHGAGNMAPQTHPDAEIGCARHRYPPTEVDNNRRVHNRRS